MILPQVHLRNGCCTSPKFPSRPDYILSRALSPTHFRLVCERSPRLVRCAAHAGGRSFAAGSPFHQRPKALDHSFLCYRTPWFSHGPPAGSPDWVGVKGVRVSPSIRKCRQLWWADLQKAVLFRVAQLPFPAAKASAGWAKNQPCYDFYFL